MPTSTIGAMPGRRAVDPVDIQAEARSHLGQSRILQEERGRINPHPGGGGSREYDVWFRLEELERLARGEPTTACRKSHRRWEQRLIPYRMTGNKNRSQIVGVDMLNLVLFLLAWPNATLDEMVVHIYNEGGDLYSRPVLSHRLGELKITKKKSAKDAYQSQRADVQFRLKCFFNEPPPLGIRDVPRFKLIDFDGFGVSLEKLNRTGGWALSIYRVRTDGHYGHGQKITCLLAIEAGDPRHPPGTCGSIENPRRWIRCIRQAGTSTIVFTDANGNVIIDPLSV